MQRALPHDTDITMSMAIFSVACGFYALWQRTPFLLFFSFFFFGLVEKNKTNAPRLAWVFVGLSTFYWLGVVIKAQRGQTLFCWAHASRGAIYSQAESNELRQALPQTLSRQEKSKPLFTIVNDSLLKRPGAGCRKLQSRFRSRLPEQSGHVGARERKNEKGEGRDSGRSVTDSCFQVERGLIHNRNNVAVKSNNLVTFQVQNVHVDLQCHEVVSTVSFSCNTEFTCHTHVHKTAQRRETSAEKQPLTRVAHESSSKCKP